LAQASQYFARLEPGTKTEPQQAPFTSPLWKLRLQGLSAAA
jgi:hypothetical protein